MVLVGTLGGYRYAGANESKRDERAETREKLARRELNSEVREQRKHEFQLTTMLDLQDVTRELARAVGKILVADEDSLRRNRLYPQVTEELNEPAYVSRRDLIRLMHRITNDSLRNVLMEFNDRTASMIVTGNNLSSINPDLELQRVIRDKSDLAVIFGQVNDKLGIFLRAVLNWQPDN